MVIESKNKINEFGNEVVVQGLSEKNGNREIPQSMNILKTTVSDNDEYDNIIEKYVYVDDRGNVIEDKYIEKMKDNT